MIDNHKSRQDMLEINKSFNINKFLDQLPTYLRELLGVSNVALLSVIRDDFTVPENFLPLIANVRWSAPHNNMMDELIRYTPHTGPSYNSDNARVLVFLVLL